MPIHSRHSLGSLRREGWSVPPRLARFWRGRTTIMSKLPKQEAPGIPPGPFQHPHDDLGAAHPPPGLDQLAQQIRETADKLVRDEASRGDMKLVSTALKELRYAFKIFKPFRHL